MGKDGEEIMLDLLLDCGIFLAVEKGTNNYYQLSGNAYFCTSRNLLLIFLFV